MNLQSMQPEQIIEPSYLPVYKQEIDILFKYLSRLNAEVFLLDKMANFPFDIFPPSEGAFWRLVGDALFETSIMIIWRVWIDTRHDGLTIGQLKNSLITKYLKRKYLDDFENTLKTEKVEKRLKRFKKSRKFESRIKNIRHGYIAHLDLKKYISPTSEDKKLRLIDMSELRECVRLLNSYFLFLCFGKPKWYLISGYYFEGCLLPDAAKSSADVGGPSDVELLLDGLARQNKELNMPEQNPELWPIRRKALEPRDLKVINSYRERFGMPPA